MTTWTAWRGEFEGRAQRPFVPVETAPEIPHAWRERLAATLAVFQLGEGGEGRIAHEIDRVALPGIDDDYRAALKLFVREEGRHARLLAAAVRALEGRLRARQWTDALFRRGRRLLGVRCKLLVLLAAEVVGDGLYGAIAGRLPDGPLRRMLAELRDDERRHLLFHLAFLERAPLPLGRALWLLVGLSASAVVLWDHWRTLRLLGASVAGTGWALLRQTGAVARRLGGRR